MKLLGFFAAMILSLATVYVVAQEYHAHDDKFKFIENKGQWPDFVFFRAENKQSKIYLEQGRILYHFMDLSEMHKAHGKEFKGEPKVRQELIAAQFIGAQQITSIEKSKPAPEYFNYFIGNDKSKWAVNAKAFADVRLNGLYPGIDLHYNNQGDFLKYDFVRGSRCRPRS